MASGFLDTATLGSEAIPRGDGRTIDDIGWRKSDCRPQRQIDWGTRGHEERWSHYDHDGGGTEWRHGYWNARDEEEGWTGGAGWRDGDWKGPDNNSGADEDWSQCHTEDRCWVDDWAPPDNRSRDRKKRSARNEQSLLPACEEDERPWKLPRRFNCIGLPLRSKEPPCKQWMKTGRCKFGITCRYHHPVNDLPKPPHRPPELVLGYFPMVMHHWVDSQSVLFPDEKSLPDGWIRTLTYKKNQVLYVRKEDAYMTFDIGEVYALSRMASSSSG